MAQGARGVQFCIVPDGIKVDCKGRATIRAYDVLTGAEHVIDVENCVQQIDGTRSGRVVSSPDIPQLKNQSARALIFRDRISLFLSPS